MQNNEYQALIAHFIQENTLDQETADAALDHAKRDGVSLAIYLLRNKLVNSKTFAKTAAKYFDLDYFDLSNFSLQAAPIDLLSEKLIAKFSVLPLLKTEQQLQVAIADPSNLQYINEIKFHTGLTIQPVLVEYDKLTRAIDILLSKQHYISLATPQEINDQNEGPIVHFVQQILTDAIHQAASDIHFEPYENLYRIRFRIDGILHEITQSPLSLANRINARLKVIAKLDIAERRLPQDGRFSFNFDNISRECRISTCPTLFGEKIVVRLLDSTQHVLNIDELGLEAQQKQHFLQMMKQPQGMVLVTGPTGSGKTITLYTALNMLNTLDKNISSVEDPVEINLAGINQVHVNPKIGLSFATALRAFLRQDPDIIMVGEIRDLETAEIAIRAAQTGHLVFSTVHTNSAAETLTRLTTMGISSFNLASAINLIIAQRLLRRLCPHCKKPQQLPAKTLKQQGFCESELNTLQLFTATECKYCIKGYKGRVGVYEVMPISEAMALMIITNASSLTIAQQAKNEGVQTLHQSALNKVRQGVTSLEEMNRVISV